MQGAIAEHQLREFKKSQDDKERSEIEQEFRLAKEYWLEMQPFVKGRILRGVEFFVARHAYRNLQTTIKKVEDWNRRVCVTSYGVRAPVVVDTNLPPDDFREPELPKMLFADNLKPESLAAIAAPLSTGAAKMNPTEAIRAAHELIMAAGRYIGTLPKQKHGTESLTDDLGLGTVTLTEIFDSNKKESGRLPLLPPQKFKRKGKSDKEILSEPQLSLKAIKEAVRKHSGESGVSTPQEAGSENVYGGEDEQIETIELTLRNILEVLPNDRISPEFLCTMRWERFKKARLEQQTRAFKREAKKKAVSKTKEPKHPKSAATSQITAGKRQK